MIYDSTKLYLLNSGKRKSWSESAKGRQGRLRSEPVGGADAHWSEPQSKRKSPERVPQIIQICVTDKSRYERQPDQVLNADHDRLPRR